MTQAGTRDASWFAYPGVASVFHVANEAGMAVCNPTGMPLAGMCDAGEVPDDLRCSRSACRLRWPPVLTHFWRLRKHLPERHGQPCAVVIRGRPRGGPANIAVRFADGFTVVTNRYAVRRRRA